MSMSRTCAGSLMSLRSSLCRATRQITESSSQSRSLHTPAPLYLDFLAPAWRPTVKAANQGQSTVPTRPTRQAQSRPISTTPRRLARAIKNPRTDDDGNDMLINISPRAAHRLQAIAEKDGNPDLALRVSVESGGCHGFQYLMSLVNTSDIDPAEDTLFENEEPAKATGDYRAKVVMDEPSLELLKGSSVDYTMELIGSQFKVTGIPGAKSSCGCGTSFDIA